MIPGDRLLCALLDSLHVGDTFPHWPLHITIIPWFRTDISSDEIGRELSQRLNALEPFLVSIESETRMGHGRTANLIAVPSPLMNIEQEARTLLHEHNAWLVDETTKRRHEFTPHITQLKSGKATEGDSFTCDSLYIIEQKGDYKEVVSRIDL